MNEKPGSTRDILTVLFKQKKKIIVTFFAVVIVITLGTFLIRPTYEASSSLLVKFGREYLYTPEVGDNRPMTMTGQEELFNSEIQILTNRDLIEKVIGTMGADKLYPSLPTFKGVSGSDAAVNEFKKNLVVEPAKKSNVIQVSFQHHNPVSAARAVNLLVDFFRDKHLQIYAGTPSAFLTRQLADYRAKLKESEDKLEAFKQAHRIYVLDEQRASLLTSRSDADKADREVESRIAEVTTKIVSLQTQMRSLPSQIPISSENERLRTTDDAEGQLLTLRLKEQEFLEKYREDNRLVVNLRKEIALLENFMKKRNEQQAKKVVTGRNGVYEDIEKELIKAEAERVSLISRREALRGQVGLIDRDLRSLDANSSELQALKREVALNEKNYQTYLERTEDARIADTMNRQKMANVSVIHAATVPTEPVKPRTGYNFILALVLGSVSGLGLAFFSEYTKQSISTPESAEKKLDLPVLGSIQNKG
jgi:uncharacterized protein involved in exopolysaccharide biosynthesis